MKKNIADKILAQVPDVYDHIADHFSLTRQGMWGEFEDFAKHVKPHDSILDAGCGNGRLMQLFEHIPCRYTGVDNSAKLLAKAQQASRQFPQLQTSFAFGSLLSLPFPDKSFNRVFCIAALHHIPSKEYQARAARELFRVLKPNGTLILTNWNLRGQLSYVMQQIRLRFLHPAIYSGTSFFDFFIPWISGQNVQYRYYRAFSKKEINRLLQRAGFCSIASELKPTGVRRNIRTTAKKDLV